MRALIELGESGRTTGTLLVTLVFTFAAGASAAKDIPGRKRCFVAGIETYKEEPVYRDKSSGFQRIQVPGAKGERCFWEPLDYESAAASVPLEASRAAPAMSSRPPRAEQTQVAAASRPAPAPTELTVSTPPSPPPSATAAPQPAPARHAALPPRTAPVQETAPRPQPQPQLPPQPQPQPRAQPQPAPPREAPPSPEPVRPILQPRGLTTQGGAPADLRIQTRPVASGGTISTVSSGPGIESLTREDQVVPPMGEPLALATPKSAMASLAPRTAPQGWEATPAPASRPEPAPQPAAEPPAWRSSPPPAPAAASAPATESGGSFVQLGSVTSYQKAKQFWADVTGRYPEILAGFTPNIVEADIPGKGIFYRVRVGPLESDEAKALCRRLGEGKCLVVSR